MAQQTLNNGESGLIIRGKINDNFTEVYTDVDTAQQAADAAQADATQAISDAATAQSTANSASSAASSAASAASAAQTDIDTHEADTNNPHGVTKAQVGLGNVPNLSFSGSNTGDQDISGIATNAAAILLKENSSNKVSNIGGAGSSSQFLTTLGLVGRSAVSVTDYGAVGDGVTNDATAIQNAINTGKAVIFPFGTYLVSTGITVSTDNQIIVSYGATLKVTTAISAITISSCSYVQLIGLNVLGDGDTGQKGINTSLTKHLKISNCSVVGCDYGFYFQPTPTETIFTFTVPISNQVENCSAVLNNIGMYWEASAEYWAVSACQVSKNVTYGMQIKAGNVSITDNTVNGNNIGIYVDGIYNSGNTDHGKIVGNTINHNRQCGLWVKSTQYTQHITGNDIWANIGDTTSGGNFAATGTSFGVYLQSCDAINLTGNTIARNKVNIGYDGLTNSVITGNLLLTDSGRTTSQFKSYGFASEKFAINGLNYIGGNSFVGSLSGGGTRRFEPNTTATKEQAVVMNNNVGTTQADYAALTSGSAAFDMDGSYTVLELESGYTGTLTMRTGRSQQVTTIYFRSVNAATKAITFISTGATTLTSYTPGATVSSLTLTLVTTGVYFIVPLTGDNYAIFGPSGNLTATATLDFGSTAAGAKTDLTVTVTGAAVGDVVTIGVPNGSVPDNGSFTAWVSATNTVTVRFTNNDLTNAKDPASGSFKVIVQKV